MAFKDRLGLGMLAMVLFSAFMLCIPHHYPMTQGVESDLFTTYIPQAELLYQQLTHERGTDYEFFDCGSWAYHGKPYPALLCLVGGLFKRNQPIPGLQYFRAAKVLSAMAAGSILLLCVLIWGYAGLPIGLFALTVPLVFYQSYCTGTDMLAAVLAIWSGYFLWKQKALWSGLFLAVSFGIRHEYGILALAALGFIYFYHPHRIKSFALFLSPLLLINLTDSGSYGTHCTAPPKYLSTVGQDEFPPEMFEDADMDTVDNFYFYQNATLKKYYGSFVGVFTKDTLHSFGILGRDLWHTLIFILTPLLSLAALLALVKWGKQHYFWMAALLLHLFAVNLFGVWSDRYFIFELIVLGIMGSAVLFRLFKMRVALLVCAVIMLPNLQKCYSDTSHNLTLQSDRFEKYRGYNLRRDQRMMSMRGQPAFVAGMKWHTFPKGVKDIYGYCRRFNINFVLWSGFEQMLRSEWGEKLNDPNLASPQFLLVDYDRGRGLLYYVNPSDSLRSEAPAGGSRK